MTAEFSALDHLHMAQALRLAERAAYTARPNPMVGCVIAHGSEVVGQGWHQRTGGPHAEVFALREAGDRARGATAYVTLEPCAHHGRTPPCALALIEAGITRVVAAMRDPFPKVDGGGFVLLRAAGIEVAEGLMAAQARELNRGFLSRIERGRPWLRVKLAASLDGRTAMVLDSRLRSLECARVREGGAPTLYLHDAAVSAPDAADAAFASVACREGRLDLGEVLALLAERGVNEVHTEAGATLAGALLAGGWVDELLLYQAPTLLGEHGLPLLSGLGIHAMDQQRRMRVVDQRQVGDDLRLLLRP